MCIFEFQVQVGGCDSNGLASVFIFHINSMVIKVSRKSSFVKDCYCVKCMNNEVLWCLGCRPVSALAGVQLLYSIHRFKSRNLRLLCRLYVQCDLTFSYCCAVKWSARC